MLIFRRRISRPAVELRERKRLFHEIRNVNGVMKSGRNFRREKSLEHFFAFSRIMFLIEIRKKVWKKLRQNAVMLNYIFVLFWGTSDLLILISHSQLLQSAFIMEVAEALQMNPRDPISRLIKMYKSFFCAASCGCVKRQKCLQP
jgi:hypothetical protein